jgi:hypothetical protein
MKKRPINVDQLDRGAFQQKISDSHCFGMSISAIEEGNNLIENIRSCDQQRQRPAQVLPVG